VANPRHWLAVARSFPFLLPSFFRFSKAVPSAASRFLTAGCLVSPFWFPASPVSIATRRSTCRGQTFILAVPLNFSICPEVSSLFCCRASIEASTTTFAVSSQQRILRFLPPLWPCSPFYPAHWIKSSFFACPLVTLGLEPKGRALSMLPFTRQSRHRNATVLHRLSVILLVLLPIGLFQFWRRSRGMIPSYFLFLSPPISSRFGPYSRAVAALHTAWRCQRVAGINGFFPTFSSHP